MDGSEDGQTAAGAPVEKADSFFGSASRLVCAVRNTPHSVCSAAVGRRHKTCSNAVSMNAGSDALVFADRRLAKVLACASTNVLFAIARACCGTMLSERR